MSMAQSLFTLCNICSVPISNLDAVATANRMCRPMTSPRTSPYLYATWIPRYLTDEKNCLYAAWFKANHQGYAKMPSDFDSAKWNMEHTDLMNELVEELEERGCEA